MGSERFIKPSEIPTKTWKEVFDDFEWDIEVDVTGESSYSKEDLATLTTVFQTIADPAKQAVLQMPQGKMLFNEILNKTSAISPVQLQALTPVGGV